MRSPSLSAMCGHLSPGRTTSTLPIPGGILWDAAGRPGIKGFYPFCAHWYMKFICHCYFIKPVYMVIYFFLLMAVYVYFFILPIAVCFLNAHCLLFYSDTPGYQKIHQCKTLFGKWHLSWSPWVLFGLYLVYILSWECLLVIHWPSTMFLGQGYSIYLYVKSFSFDLKIPVL